MMSPRRERLSFVWLVSLVCAGCSAGPGDDDTSDGSQPSRDASVRADAGQSVTDASTADASMANDASTPVLVWHQANLTNYTSYPEPGSEECEEFNGCMWAGMFAAIEGTQTEAWVMAHNIAAVHEDDFEQYKLKTLRLRQGNRTIDVTVYDMCADSDCEGCCTNNASENGLDFLIDIESYTMQRFGSGGGIVEWACIDC